MLCTAVHTYMLQPAASCWSIALLMPKFDQLQVLDNATSARHLSSNWHQMQTASRSTSCRSQGCMNGNTLVELAQSVHNSTSTAPSHLPCPPQHHTQLRMSLRNTCTSAHCQVQVLQHTLMSAVHPRSQDRLLHLQCSESNKVNKAGNKGIRAMQRLIGVWVVIQHAPAKSKAKPNEAGTLWLGHPGTPRGAARFTTCCKQTPLARPATVVKSMHATSSVGSRRRKDLKAAAAGSYALRCLHLYARELTGVRWSGCCCDATCEKQAARRSEAGHTLWLGTAHMQPGPSNQITPIAGMQPAKGSTTTC